MLEIGSGVSGRKEEKKRKTSVSIPKKKKVKRVRWLFLRHPIWRKKKCSRRKKGRKQKTFSIFKGTSLELFLEKEQAQKGKGSTDRCTNFYSQRRGGSVKKFTSGEIWGKERSATEERGRKIQHDRTSLPPGKGACSDEKGSAKRKKEDEKLALGGRAFIIKEVCKYGTEERGGAAPLLPEKRKREMETLMFAWGN